MYCNKTMADDIFIYRGGRAPQHVTHVLIDESVDEIEANAFDGCENLLTVDTHCGIRKVWNLAFYGCNSLRQIDLKSVIEIDAWAFFKCDNLESVEFGDMLETIGTSAFNQCSSLKHLRLSSIIDIGASAFFRCTGLIDVELSERLEIIEVSAFWNCERLQRIAIPLKRDLFEFNDDEQRHCQFDDCEELTKVDLVGGIHETVASLQWKVGGLK